MADAEYIGNTTRYGEAEPIAKHRSQRQRNPDSCGTRTVPEQSHGKEDAEVYSDRKSHQFNDHCA
ncbi:hypothetical protein RRF57_008375 [Xylaria bambusicola]|uniref:Uncharacterized protein n=1 Tax=Xylaria bambusicola TaxID=326684 RepID=A0AAN7ZAX8_9PEZI